MKAWYLSKTLQGQIAVVVGQLIGWLNIPLLPEEAESLVAVVFTVAGVLYSIYGRVKTKGESLSIR